MRKTLWVVAIVLAVLTCAPAIASAHDWSGFYVGLNAGGISNHDTGEQTCYTPAGVKDGTDCIYPASGNMNGAGFLGGVTLGWNWQLGPLVLGPEFDYDGTTTSLSSNWQGMYRGIGTSGTEPGTFSATESISSFQSERIRVGFASHDTLIYATGGWAQAAVTVGATTVCFACGGGTDTSSGQSTLFDSGWTEGVGGEWAVGHHVTMKLEALLYTLEPFSPRYSFTSAGYSAGKDFYFHGAVARLGINWRL